MQAACPDRLQLTQGTFSVKQQYDEQARFRLFVIMPMHNVISDLLLFLNVLCGIIRKTFNVFSGTIHGGIEQAH